MARAQRPMSPHLQVYRWQITMWLSSLHRITGMLLSLGAVALAAWLIGLAGGADAYQHVQQLFASTWFKLPLTGWTFCFFFHLFNGVRHLAWDAGLGFERQETRASGWAVIVATAVATAAFSFVAIL
ncbi:MAG TPA: succinate dehydrogenase, cytochrome b556 subunit [Gammaproteobacteria bacterium]|nr:succinate dehydrogenase, cytochrome b556 subunit [Gammaproteobacteria bacterium]